MVLAKKWMTFLHYGIRELGVCGIVSIHWSGRITFIGHDRRILPVSLALIEHLNFTKDTAAAVTWSFLDDLEHKIKQDGWQPWKCTEGLGKTEPVCEWISGWKLSPHSAPQNPTCSFVYWRPGGIVQIIHSIHKDTKAGHKLRSSHCSTFISPCDLVAKIV